MSFRARACGAAYDGGGERMLGKPVQLRRCPRNGKRDAIAMRHCGLHGRGKAAMNSLASPETGPFATGVPGVPHESEQADPAINNLRPAGTLAARGLR